jgi:MOSC domain-containing protein YiiM
MSPPVAWTFSRCQPGPGYDWADAVIELTGLRNPWVQLDGLQPGLMKAVLGRDNDGNLVRRAGVMAIVLTRGPSRPGDSIAVELPEAPLTPLAPI